MRALRGMNTWISSENYYVKLSRTSPYTLYLTDCSNDYVVHRSGCIDAGFAWHSSCCTLAYALISIYHGCPLIVPQAMMAKKTDPSPVVAKRLNCYLLDQLEAVFLNFINEGFDGSEHLGSEGFGLDTVINLCRQTQEN